MFRLLITFSLLNLINSQSFLDLPEYGYPPVIQPNGQMNHMYRNKMSTVRRDSNDQQQQAMLRKFYELNLLKNYQLNYTDWSFVWFEFEEMSIKNQTTLIKELRAKQKTIEVILIQLCENKCLREICEMPINQQTNAILPRNSDSWLRFSDMNYDEIPLKIKKLIILQLKIDRFRTANSLAMMVNELCPYNKYFDDVQSNLGNRQNGLPDSANSKLQNGDLGHNNLDGKPIEN